MSSSNAGPCCRMRIYFRCKSCGLIFPSKPEVVAHLEIHRKIVPKLEATNGQNGCIIASQSSEVPLIINQKNDLKEKDKKQRNRFPARPKEPPTSVISNDTHQFESEEESDDDFFLRNISKIPDCKINLMDCDDQDIYERDYNDDQVSPKVFKCACKKEFFIKISFENHQKFCSEVANDNSKHPHHHLLDSPISKKASNGHQTPYLESFEDAVDELSSTELEKSLSSLRFGRELIEQVHADGDFSCKACSKPLKCLVNISVHLNRSANCRSYYLEDLLPHLGEHKPSSPSCVDSSFENRQPLKLRISLSKKSHENPSIIKNSAPFLKTRPHRSRRVPPQPKAKEKESFQPCAPENITAEIDVDSFDVSESSETNNEDSSDVVMAPENELISRAYLVRNSVQCPKCLKIFRGKTPAVAYNNHRRNKHCPAAGTKALFIRNKKGRRTKHNEFSSSKDHKAEENTDSYSKASYSAASSPALTDDSKGKASTVVQPPQPVRYFCKLCHNKEVKNRVSLGVHLTTYHGLPPVNITVDGSLALRCQTCTKTFISKYFYNMHRYECDLTSPYIGISNAA